MIKVILPTHLYNEMSDEEVKDICTLSYGNDEIIKEEEYRGYNSGQYIKLYKDNKVKYICLSRNDLQSRNAFILQNFPSAYQHFLEENINKEFEYYIRYFGQAHPPYVIFSYKVLLTIGIKILNLSKVVPSNSVSFLDHRTPFIDYKQMRKARLELQSRNSGNISTLFEETENEISVYGKTYGANGRETTAICLALKKLVDLPIKVYNVNETDSQHLAYVDPANKYILDYYNISVDDGRMNFEPSSDIGVAKRDQSRYHYNLLQKFKEKKCYLCECDIERLIIGSHIHRVTDIIHSNLDEAEKQRQIIDGDNGFWLCSNHDKLFEYGLIYFEGKKFKISDKLNEKQKKYIEFLTFDIRKETERFNKIIIENNTIEQKIFYIKDCNYNENMHRYLELHRLRTQDIYETDEDEYLAVAEKNEHYKYEE
jgi:hypothetical protein